MWPYPWTHVGTPSHLGHMDRVAATMPSQAHAGAAQEAPDIGQWEGQDVPLVRPSSCNVKGGIPSSRRYLPTYLLLFPPPPGLWFVFFCAPSISGFLSFPAPGALGLGAVCCLFSWPPASRLSVLSRLVCVSRPAVGCSLVVLARPPPFVSRGFRRCLSMLVFFLFSLCANVVSGFRWFPASVALGLGAVGFSFVALPLLCSLRALSPLLCVPPRRWLLSGGCCPPPPSPFWRAVFVARCSVFCCFFFRSFVLSLSLPPLSLAFSGFRPRMPLALALCAFVLVASHFSARCALSPLLCFPPGPWLLPGGSCTPPLSVSRGFRRSVPGFFFLFFLFLRPRVSRFFWFPAPGALGLGAVCCLFHWPPASRCALSPLLCFPRGRWLLTGGCSPLLLPFCVSGFLSLNFFSFVVRLRCLRLFRVSGPGCPGPWRSVLFVSRAAGCGAPCFASSGVVSCGAASVVCFVLCLVLCGVLVSGWVLAPCCGGSCCAVFVVLCCCALLHSLLVFFFVVPFLSVVLRAVSVSMLCLCVAVPVCLRCCSLCVALLPLLRWLVFCVVV